MHENKGILSGLFRSLGQWKHRIGMTEQNRDLYVIQYACISHKGSVRYMNQDNIAYKGRYLSAGEELRDPEAGIEKLVRPTLFGVFDGMGGEQNGEMASYMAAKAAAEWKMSGQKDPLNKLCIKMNGQICAYTEEKNLNTCGTTAAIVILDRDRIIGCNLGDSRIYYYRHGNIEQVSEDHVLPYYGKKKAPLVQYLGIRESESTLEPTFFKREPEPGDQILLCSDGLTDMVSDDDIVDCIIKNKKVGDQAEQLLDRTLKAGGIDNISFVIIRIEKDQR